MSRRGAPLALALAALFGLSLAAPVLAGPNRDAKLLLHLVATEKRRGGNCFSGLPENAEQVLTQGSLQPQDYYAFVVIVDFDTTEGVAGVQFGISYDGAKGKGVDIEHWQNCALYEWPMDDWPDPGTGNLLTWSHVDDCQEEVPIPVGFFFLTAHSNDRLKLIPRPVDGLARLAVCGRVGNRREKAESLQIENLGWVDFGGGPGYNPWDPKQNLLNIPKKFKRIK